VPGAFLAIILGVTATFVGVGASAATPAPTSIAPTSGAVGTSVTVTGTGFTSPGLSATVAGEPVTVTVNSSTSATLVVPGDAPSGTVTIALSNGGSALSPSFSFTVFQFTSGFADAEVGANYTPRVGVTGGKAPYTWLVASGTLPAGLSFSSSGAFSGAPKASGASTVTVQATDANGGAAQYLLTITVDPGPTIVTASFPTATIDTAYSTTLSVIGGTPPYSWAIASGPIPGGLVLSSTGVLSGRPGALGGSSIAVRGLRFRRVPELESDPDRRPTGTGSADLDHDVGNGGDNLDSSSPCRCRRAESRSGRCRGIPRWHEDVDGDRSRFGFRSLRDDASWRVSSPSSPARRGHRRSPRRFGGTGSSLRVDTSSLSVPRGHSGRSAVGSRAESQGSPRRRMVLGT
jgi:hypothetical protein